MILLSVKEAAAKLNAHPGLVYSLAASGKLRHCRIGNGRGRLRIPEDAIGEYLARCTFGVGQEKPAARMPKLSHIKLKP